MIPGEIITQDGDITLNAERPTVKLTITNSGDWPNIQSDTSTWWDVNSAVNPPDMERKTRQLAMFFSPPGFMVHSELGLLIMLRCHCA